MIRPILAALTLLLAANGPGQIASGARYVAMGSSYAAGPGIGTSADTPPTRCARSGDNYAHQLARARGLTLVDVSCSGATTRHVLGAWNELPAQLDAVTADTRLVTVTIGGNDVFFTADLMKASAQPSSPLLLADEAQWRDLETRMQAIADGVRQRAPAARLIFVAYPLVLPVPGGCAATPLSPADAAVVRTIAARLAGLTARVAAKSGAGLIDAARLSRGHDACARDPWITGDTPPPGAAHFVPYHPNLAGMTAVARALNRALGG